MGILIDSTTPDHTARISVPLCQPEAGYEDHSYTAQQLRQLADLIEGKRPKIFSVGLSSTAGYMVPCLDFLVANEDRLFRDAPEAVEGDGPLGWKIWEDELKRTIQATIAEFKDRKVYATIEPYVCLLLQDQRVTEYYKSTANLYRLYFRWSFRVLDLKEGQNHTGEMYLDAPYKADPTERYTPEFYTIDYLSRSVAYEVEKSIVAALEGM